MDKYIVLFFIFFLIAYSYMMMEPVIIKPSYNKIYISPDDKKHVNKEKNYNEIIIRNENDFEKTYYANSLA